MEEEKLVKQLISLHLHKDATGMRTFSVRLPQHVYDALRFQCTAEDKQSREVNWCAETTTSMFSYIDFIFSLYFYQKKRNQVILDCRTKKPVAKVATGRSAETKRE